ncbi:MAG TPA: plasmid stabilization protein [Thermoanaerobaculia bacterium]|nr:plasmid stabilization protein [Thermoanaerobaculia bacterium]
MACCPLRLRCPLSGERVRPRGRQEVTMPESWSNKDERQYEHIKSSAKKKGRSAKTAKRIAAATVNKQRSSEGRTKSGGAKSASSKGGSTKRKGSGGSKKSSSKRGSSSKKAAAGRKGGKATARKRSKKS